MDRTHVLAAQNVPTPDRNRPATRSEIDAFYDEHGHEVFALACRVRRWLGARATTAGQRGAPRPGFAPLARTR